MHRVRDEQRALYASCGYSRLQPLLPYRALRFGARRFGRDWERDTFMNPQLDDVEAELTYLRIRDLRPDTVVELGPFRGWSTTWMLRALRDNGKGTMTSFDLVDTATRFVPVELKDRWQLVVGDARAGLAAMPDRIDYLFVDADHRAPFARWYLEAVMPRVAGGGSVHDVFHSERPGRMSGEAEVVLDWFGRERVEWMTASRFAAPRTAQRIAAVRCERGLGPNIHFGDHDSAVFFSLSAGRS